MIEKVAGCRIQRIGSGYKIVAEGNPSIKNALRRFKIILLRIDIISIHDKKNTKKTCNNDYKRNKIVSY